MSITTRYQDLKNIFNHNIRAKDLAEFLISFDYDQQAKNVKEAIKGRGFTVVGVRKYGDVIGFVNVEELNDNGLIADYMKDINYENEISENEGIMETLNKLEKSNYFFVKILNQYGGIITRSDINKITFRLWIYGTLSIFEILLLDILRLQKQDENTITRYLEPDRISACNKLFEERKNKDEFIDILECLQLGDKLTICVLKNKTMLKTLKLTEKEAQFHIRGIEHLRNTVSHSNDYERLGLPRFHEVLKFMHDFIEKNEKNELAFN